MPAHVVEMLDQKRRDATKVVIPFPGDLWIITKEGDQTAPVLFEAEHITADDLKEGEFDFANPEPMPALDQESRPRIHLEPGTDYRMRIDFPQRFWHLPLPW